MNVPSSANSPRKRKLQLLESLLAKEGVRHGVGRAVGRREDLEQVPLSFAQQRIWFLDQLEPGPQYNDPFHLRLTGSLDLPALEHSLNEIVRRHDALRARFEIVEGRASQRILPPFEITLPVLDLSALPATERENQAMRIAFEEGRCEFKLQHGPLFRAKVLSLGPTDHLLLMTFHHIAMDGWSRAVFLQELSALYGALVAGRPSPLPELAIQYADFAAWQQNQMQGEGLEKHLHFWKEQLHGSPARLEWPTDFPRPAVQSFRGARLEINIDASLMQKLKELSRQEGCTLFMTLLAAFQTLAMRYTGQEDIVIGSPVANRNRSEIEGLIGYFLNTLVLRADLSGEPTFRQALRRVREAAMAAYAHQDLPYEKLVEELNPTRDTSYNAIFQVMFIFQNTPPLVPATGGLNLSPFEVHNGTAKVDLTLTLSENLEGLSGWIEYATDLFKAESITRLRGHFQTLLEEITRDPDQRITMLPMLTEGETRQMQEWNDTHRKYPTELCVHELFERQRARTPGAAAVAFEGRRLTYQELDDQANQLAGELQTLGVKAEVLVGIYMERSLEMLVAVLGILKAGGAYVPLDPLLPTERLAFILEDAQVSIMITQTSLAEAVSKWSLIKQKNFAVQKAPAEVSPDLSILQLKAHTSAATKTRLEDGCDRVQPQNLAYVIYTSGSTGKPKGVQISHRSVVNLLDSMRSVPGISASDTMLAVTTLSFDIAGLELLLPLTVGGRVAIASREVAMDGRRLTEELERSGVTIMQATPTTWRLLLAAGWSGNPRLKVLCGGEAWSAELARPLLDRCGSLWNMYGPTETTIWSAVQRIGAEAEVVIGAPIANTQFHVLDRRMQPVPIGVIGELCISGDGLARGYWRRAELTGEKFVAHPQSGAAGARLYKSGDLVRFLSDGRLEFLGRLDHQVKIRGYRIETAEVEALLAQHPAVRECVVVAQPDASGENRLVAYFVGEAGDLKNPQELRRYLNGKLPDYMTPALFVPLSELPRTPNGKVNRSELPTPETVHANPAAGSTITATPIEAAVAEIWREVLGLAEVGLNDNFFELGGHSLMVTQAIARIRQTFEIELPMRALFEAPTIAAAALMIEQKLMNDDGLRATLSSASNPAFPHRRGSQAARC